MPLDLVRRLPYDHPYRWDGRKFGGTKLWTPDEIETEGWYDAYDTATITESSGSVSQWNDKSGNGNHVAQATPGYQPLYSATGWDGFMPSILFDGSDDLLSKASFSCESASEWVVFAVLDQASTAKTRQLVLELLGTCLYFSKNGYATVPGMGLNDSVYVGESDAYQTGKQILTWVYEDSGQFYRNGDAVNMTDPSWTPTNGSDFSGATLNMARQANYQIEADIAEIIICRRAIATEAVRQQIEGYLAWKWFLEGSLVAGHPYENYAPTV